MSSPAPAVAAGPAPLQRLHPLTPVLRGAKFFIAAVAVLSARELSQFGIRRALIGLAVVIVVAFVLSYVSWRFTWYRVEGKELHLESGVLFRRSRRVPLERVQAIDIVRPLVGRILGLAELRLEVVGQGATEAPLAYLTEAEAHRLRARLLALAAGVDADTPAPDEEVLARVPSRDLVISVLLLGQVVVGVPLLILAGAVMLVIDIKAFFASLPVLGSFAYGIGTVSVRRVLMEYGFTLAESPDGLRLRHGLLETRAQTVPPGRVQAIRLIQPVLWRHRDWVRVEVDVAGYAAGDEAKSVTGALLPVAPRPVAEAVLRRVLGGVDVATMQRRPVPRRAAWLDPVQWRQMAIGLTPEMLVVFSGRLRRVTDVIPLAKVQSLRLVQGPLQRGLGLATLHPDTAGRNLSAVMAHRDAGEVLALVHEVSDLARTQREIRRRPR
ncbi:MAG: PH domain-containing protein [Mycobacteriales bacterium]